MVDIKSFKTAIPYLLFILQLCKEGRGSLAYNSLPSCSTL